MSWSTVWAAVSAISTALTALIALLAIYRWRKQDELKAKLEFKKAVSVYAWRLTQLPELLEQHLIVQAYAREVQALHDALSACHNAWLVSEGLMEVNKEVTTGWKYIFENNNLYVGGKMHSSELGIKAMNILHEKFVFR